MKKALLGPNEVFLYMKNGKPHPGGVHTEEVLAAINRGLKGDWGTDTDEVIILRKLYEWICRYIDEGATDKFCHALNNDLQHMQFLKNVVPPDFFPSEDGNCQGLYLADLDKDYSYEVHAAHEFSKLVTTGKLNKLKRCQMPGCENIFLGPPQAKWCSKNCGSKYRVRQKRKRDLS